MRITLLCILYFLMFRACFAMSSQVRNPTPPARISRHTGSDTPALALKCVREENSPVLVPMMSKPALQKAETEWKTAIRIPAGP